MFNASRNIHPGEILRACYIKHASLSLEGIDERLDFDVEATVEGERPIREEDAEELADFFDVPKRSWIQLQLEHDAEKQRQADPSYPSRL